MHSVPERTRKQDKRSRYDQYGPDHPYTALPDLDEYEYGYMSGLFIDAGICNRSGMGGASALEWKELESFDNCGRLELSAWELSQLMEMSRAYCKWHALGSQQGDIADDVPYIDETRSAGGYLMRSRDASKKNISDAESDKLD